MSGAYNKDIILVLLDNTPNLSDVHKCLVYYEEESVGIDALSSD